MPDKYFELIQKTIKCIKGYEMVTHSVDTHFDDFVQKKKIKDMHELVFMKAVFYGVIRYEPLMKVNM